MVGLGLIWVVCFALLPEMLMAAGFARLLRAGEQAVGEHEVASAPEALSELEGGDAEHPLQAQRWDRAGIHARSLEHRLEL